MVAQLQPQLALRPAVEQQQQQLQRLLGGRAGRWHGLPVGWHGLPVGVVQMPEMSESHLAKLPLRAKHSGPELDVPDIEHPSYSGSHHTCFFLCSLPFPACTPLPTSIDMSRPSPQTTVEGTTHAGYAIRRKTTQV